jgi:glycosyltransferase involved in cell wall biosynthesis
MPAMTRRVLFWGRFDPGYSRNRVYAALFRELGWEVDYFFVKWFPRFGDIEAAVRGLWRRPKPDLVWVPVCRQRDILAACRWAHRHGVKALFDPMISAWDKKVLEQRKWKAEEPRARKLLALETKMMHAPDMVTWDTSCHLEFCARTFNVPREKMRVLLTGTDETVFKPMVLGAECLVPGAELKQQDSRESSAPSTKHQAPSTFTVLYHGAYLPLHGTEYIVEAARMTQDENIQWDFLGWGAYKAETEAKAAGIRNVRFLDKVPYVDVPKVICAHDVVLGVFGTTEKASRVIGNKVYECMACARPTINEFCTGYPPEAKDCPAIKFVPPGDAKAIADAVRAYRDDWARRDFYFAAARDFFEKHLSMAVIKGQLAAILADMGFGA